MSFALILGFASEWLSICSRKTGSGVDFGAEKHVHLFGVLVVRL